MLGRYLSARISDSIGREISGSSNGGSETAIYFERRYQTIGARSRRRYEMAVASVRASGDPGQRVAAISSAGSVAFGTVRGPRESLCTIDPNKTIRDIQPMTNLTETRGTPTLPDDVTIPVVGRIMRAGVWNLLHSAFRYLPLLAFFAAWELFIRTNPSLSIYLPAPTQVLEAAVQLIRDGQLPRDVLASLKRVAVALAFASLIGFPLGFAVGGSRKLAWFGEPILNFFRPIPPLAWIPLSIVWLGISDAQNEFIIFLGAFFPIVLNTVQGVRGVEKQLVRAARTLGAGPLAIQLTVVLPASLPSIFTGFRVGTGIAWMALVAGELVAATSGLGFLISQGRLLFRSDYIVVGMVTIGLIGLLLDALVVTVQRFIVRGPEV